MRWNRYCIVRRIPSVLCRLIIHNAVIAVDEGRHNVHNALWKNLNHKNGMNAELMRLLHKSFGAKKGEYKVHIALKERIMAHINTDGYKTYIKQVG